PVTALPTLPPATTVPVATELPTTAPSLPTEEIAAPSATETMDVPTATPEPPTATPTPTPTMTSTPVPDSDGDGVEDAIDACPGVADSGFDSDGDGLDDACDPTPLGEPTAPPVVEYQVTGYV